MARTRYFCVATKTTIETNKNNKIKVAPVTKVILFVDMNVGIKSILYMIWAESQAGHSTDNEVLVDADNNVFHLIQKNADGSKKDITWSAVPCRGVKWNDTFEQVGDIQNVALDFVGDMYAEYSVARMKHINTMIASGMTDEQIQATGVTTDEIEKAKRHKGAEA